MKLLLNKNSLVLIGLIIVNSACQKPDEIITGGGVNKGLRVSKQPNEDPSVFKEFTGESPNPYAMENVKPPDIPDHERYIQEPPLSNTINLEWFHPFGLPVVKIPELNIYTYINYEIPDEAVVYSKLDPVTYTLYYNGITYDFRDIPPEENKFFEGLFSMYIREPTVRYVTLYARIFYQSQRGEPVYKTTTSKNLFKGASDILELTIKNHAKNNVDDPLGHGEISRIKYKIKQDPWNLFPDNFPLSVLNNPRPGLYNFLLVVTDRRSLIEQPVSDPIAYYTNKENIKLRWRVISKAIRYGFKLTLLDENFNNENAADPTDLYNGNVFKWTWYPNNLQADNFPHSIIPNVIFTADNYTQAEYNTYTGIPDNDSRRFLSIDDSHPFQPTEDYCFKAYFAKNIQVSNSFLRLINPGQPSYSYGRDQYPVKINFDGNVGVRVSTYSRSTGGVQGRSFLYGKISAKINFPPVVNNNNLPNGIFSAFWLYEFHHNGFPENYNHHCNNGIEAAGKQLNEIGIEFTSSNTPGNILVGMGIIDYNCGPHPFSGVGTTGHEVGPSWTNNGYVMQRSVNHLPGGGSIIGVNTFWDVQKSFFNTPHIYTIDWDYDRVVFYIDGIERALFTSEDVAIPSYEMAITINNGWGSGGMVNGNWYALKNIPFPATEKAVEVDWVKLE